MGSVRFAPFIAYLGMHISHICTVLPLVLTQHSFANNYANNSKTSIIRQSRLWDIIPIHSTHFSVCTCTAFDYISISIDRRLTLTARLLSHRNGSDYNAEFTLSKNTHNRRPTKVHKNTLSHTPRVKRNIRIRDEIAPEK